jgi:hypothetical protein
MAAVSAEESARMAADDALDARLDVIEGDNTVAGSVAKALKDAKDYTDSEVSAEESARMAAVSAEESARIAADSDLDARLDILEGSDTTAGSVSKALKDAKDYTDQEVANLINGAPGVLDTLKELADALGGDENFAATLSNTLADIQSDISALESASSGDLASEESARIAADNALDARLDVIEGDNTTAGSVAKALKDAQDYTDVETSARMAAVSAEESARIAADGVLQDNIDAEESARMAAVSAEESARMAAVSAEESARIAADNALDSRLDVLEGDNTVAGSVAKAQKDAQDYTDSEVSAEESARIAADNVLQGNIDAEESARIAADHSLDARLDVIEGSNTTAGSVAKAQKDAQDYTDQEVSAEETARIAADGVLQSNIDALDSRLDVIEGSNTTAGSVAKAQKDAQDYADSLVDAEESARIAADNDLDARLDVIEGADTVAGSVAKALKDAKAYTDSEVSAEASSRSTADAALQSAIDALEAVVHEKEKFVLTGTDISNGYIVLAHQVIEKSIMMTVDRLVAHAGDDYTVSVVGGYTRITFAGSLMAGEDEELSAGDIVRVMYRYS